jgi:subtilisin family serine protease
VKRRIHWATLFVIIGAGVSFYTLSLAQSQNNRKRGIIVRATRPYDSVKNAIRGLGGEIIYEYENLDAIAVTVPEDKLLSLSALVGASVLYKDVSIRAPEPPRIPGGVPAKGITLLKLTPQGTTQLNGDDLAALGATLGTNTTYNNPFTGAAQLHANGIRGKGVVVAVMDSGVANSPKVVSLAGSVIGGETFVPSDPVASATSSLNIPHGTQVGSLIAAHAGFIFGNNSSLVQSLLIHAAGSVIRCPNRRFPSCSAGQSVVPMIGAAPEAQIYAVKVFDSLGNGAPKSRFIAAMDRLITLRRNFDRGRPSVPVNTPCGTEDNPCKFNSLNVQVANMSLGGPTLFAGRELEDELTVTMIKAGIVPVVSAGNEGSAAMTVGSPATGFGALAVGAANTVLQERVYRDVQFGVGVGDLFRPTTHQQTADFSSRGPTADGRIDPELISSGFGNYTQAADGSITFVLGTSFSAPTASGVAALLFGAVRAGSATAAEVRNALVDGANGSLIGDGSGPIDQGNGYLNAVAALNRLRSGRAGDDIPGSNPSESVADNIRDLGFKPVKFQNRVFSTRIQNLRPGQVAHFFIETRDEVNRLVFRLRNITPQLPPDKQNQIFGDDLIVRIMDASTSAFLPKVDEFIATDSAFTLDEPQTGLVRIAVQGDWTNAGRISTDLVIEKSRRPLQPESAEGKISQQEQIEFRVNMPAGKSNATFELFWDNDWSKYPTNDLDMIVCPPDSACSLAGSSLSSPERAVFQNPVSGAWRVFVNGFTLNTRTDKFKLRATADGERLKAK